MVGRLRKLLYAFLETHEYETASGLYFYTVLLTVAIGAFALQTVFLLFYITLPCLPLVWANILSLAAYAMSIILTRKKHYNTAGILLALTIAGYCFTAILVLGARYYTLLYFFVVAQMVMVIPFQHRWIKQVLVSAQFLFVVAAFIMEYYDKSTTSWGISERAFSFTNLVVAFIALMALLLLEKGVRNFLESFREQQVLELQTQANIDPLTGLHNRRYLDYIFDGIRSKGDKAPGLCVAIADLDNFKRVNDTYGHEEGDKVLLRVSELMRSNLRKSDYVFRWGGEEFLLIIDCAKLEQGMACLNNIRKKIEEERFHYNGNEYRITITAGLAPLNPKDITASLKQCDDKLYEGKRTGKNKVVV